MRTRRSENGPGLGSQNEESDNEIRHSPLKKRIRKDLGQILPRRRVTRSRLAIVEIDASESEGDSIGDLAPYDNGSQRSVSYTRHRKLRSRGSPARSKSIPTRRSGRRDQSEDNRPTRSPRRSLRSLSSTRQEDHEEDHEEDHDLKRGVVPRPLKSLADFHGATASWRLKRRPSMPHSLKRGLGPVDTCLECSHKVRSKVFVAHFFEYPHIFNDCCVWPALAGKKLLADRELIGPKPW